MNIDFRDVRSRHGKVMANAMAIVRSPATRRRLGLVLLIVGAIVMAPFIAIAIFTRRHGERG
jgi:hypothetical protein